MRFVGEGVNPLSVEQLVVSYRWNILPEDLYELHKFPNLRILSIVDCEDISDECIEVVSTLQNLTSLELSFLRITDKALLYISSMTQLTSLTIEDCDISDIGISYLVVLENLQKLVLDSLDISEYSLFALAKLRNLKKLRISSIWRNKIITDRGIKSISRLLCLEDLSLPNCSKITEEGFNYLAPLKNLRKLELDHCSHEEGTLQVLENFSQLTELKLPFFWCSKEGALSSIRHLDKLEYLDLRLGYLQKNRAQYLTSLSNLNTLILNKTTIEDLSFLSSLSQLHTLDLSSCEVPLEELIHIQTLTNLCVLYLSSLPITDKELLYVKPLQTLRVLYLDDCNLVSDTGLQYISELQNLQSVNLSRKHLLKNDPITDEGIRHLANCKQLSDLVMYKCTNLTNNIFNYLSPIKTLEFANVVMCRHISEEGAKKLPDVKIERTKWKKLKKKETNDTNLTP